MGAGVGGWAVKVGAKKGGGVAGERVIRPRR